MTKMLTDIKANGFSHCNARKKIQHKKCCLHEHYMSLQCLQIKFYLSNRYNPLSTFLIK